LATVHPLPVGLGDPLAAGAARVMDAAELTISVRVEPSLVVLELFGELDMASAPALERELRLAERVEGVRTIVVDLSALHFLDTTGMSALVHAVGRGRRANWTLGLLRPSGQVERTLELSGLASVLPFLD
jgi:anti-anti-sigma factor